MRSWSRLPARSPPFAQLLLRAGHVVRPEVHYSTASFTLRGYEIVGGYALQPAWGDGHGTGIYSYPFLRRLSGMT